MDGNNNGWVPHNNVPQDPNLAQPMEQDPANHASRDNENGIIDIVRNQLRLYDEVASRRSQEMADAAATRAQQAEAQITQLQQMFQTFLSRSGTPGPSAPPLAATPAAPTPLAPSRHILPKPASFDGSKKTYPAWKRYMLQKIATDIADDRALRVNYVSAYCSGEAAAFVHDFIERPDNAHCSYVDVLKHLSNRYEDPHKKENAMRELNELQMKSLSFEEFVGKFETLESESGASVWPEAARVQTMKNKVAPWLRDLTVLGVDPLHEDTLNHYVQRLRTIVNRHNEVQGFQRGKNKSRETKPFPPVVALAPEDKGDPMDWTKTNAAHTNQRPFAPAYSEKEYRARIKAKVCTTCGNAGHFSKACKYRRAANQERFPAASKTNSVSTTTSQVSGNDLPRIQSLADDNSSDSEN